MTLLWADGFESYGDGTAPDNAPDPPGIMATKYIMSYEQYFDIVTGRGGVGQAIYFTSQDISLQTPILDTTDSTLIMGFAFKYSSAAPWTYTYLCNLYTNGIWGLSLVFDDDGSLYVQDAGYTELGRTDITLLPDKWYWIEWKVFVDNTAGTVDVRLGADNVLSLTGVDTQYNSDAWYNQVKLKNSFLLKPYVDDLYICDGAGSDNNDFLGNVRVKTLRPNGDSSTQWTPTSLNNYEDVDDVICDEGTTYVTDNTANNKDLYTYEDLSDLTTIKGIIISTVAALDVTGSETFQTVVSSGGTEETSSNHTINSTSYVTKIHISEQDPNTSSAWTDTTVDSVLFGIKYI